MSERPARLPTCARRVIKGCRPIPWAARALLLELHELDAGPEGCWLAVPHLAERLGIGASSIQKYLERFVELGLVVRIKRPGARTPGWVVSLPLDCVPAVERPSPEQVRACVERLIHYLQTGRASGVKPEPERSETGRPSSIRPESLPVSAERGGETGGAPAAGNGHKTALPLQLPEEAVGEGARAPERQRERDPESAQAIAKWEQRTGRKVHG